MEIILAFSHLYDNIQNQFMRSSREYLNGALDWSKRLKKLIWIVISALTAGAGAGAEAHAATFNNGPRFGFIDLLTWQVRESSAENWAQLISPAGTQRSIKIIDAPFNWNEGIRIGIGYIFPEDCYDLTLAYTHYQTNASNHASGMVFSSFVGNYFANNTNGANFGPTYHSANIHWQFIYNNIDLNLGRNFKLDPLLQLHPFIGLKAASINQKIVTHWFNPTTAINFTHANEDLTNNFWGIGLSMGVDSAWPIFVGDCQSLSLLGNIALGLLWGHFNFSELYTNNAPTTIRVKVSNVNGASPVANGFLGLEWIKQFLTADIRVRLGYEAQIWFNQIQFYSLNMGRINRPVSLQGGDLEFRFNF